jgi:hypothetical protein
MVKKKVIRIMDTNNNDNIGKVLSPNNQGKHLVWSINFNHLSNGKIDDNDIYILELLGDKVFDKHRLYQFNNSGEEGNYNYAVLLGQLKIRKRETTMIKHIDRMMDDLCLVNQSLADGLSNLNFKVIPCHRTFNSCVEDYSPISNSSNADYYGQDILFLNDKQNRKEWQNYLLNTIYNEESNIFTKSDDRSIIWIEDKLGNTGKSKWIKWLCANREEDVMKLTFGSTQQLKSALISGGSRKVYFVDIPRTKSKEDSLPALISVVEDLKNGHLSSVMYGNYKSLFLEPPHVLVFSNNECPIKLMSADRWIWLRISPDGDSFKIIK